ncbi:MAG: LPXTG cell wall anchor domain-containing protein [Planctomycetota bacterium]|nr:LPXTG cell wall anchor domain-containing protein [Planctomycetota bacterium]
MKPALWITLLLLTAGTPSFADLDIEGRNSEQSTEGSLPLALIAGIAVLGIGVWWVLRTKKNG